MDTLDSCIKKIVCFVILEQTINIAIVLGFNENNFDDYRLKMVTTIVFSKENPSSLGSPAAKTECGA
jgi:hypothetical protein